MPSPLETAAQSVDPVANPMGALQSLALQSAQRGDTYLQQQQEAYNRQIEQLRQLTQNPPESDESQMWGAIAGGAARVAPNYGNFGTMLASMGQAYGQQQGAADQQRFLREQALTKLLGDELRALESKQQMGNYLKALGGQKGLAPVVKVVDGKLVKYDPVAGSTEVLAGTQDQIKTRLYTTFLTAALKNEVPNPEEYARQQTEAAIRGFGGLAVKGENNKIPGTTSVDAAPQPELLTDEAAGVSFKFDVSGLGDEDKDLLRRVIGRYKANPNPGTLASTEQILSGLFSSGKLKEQPVAPAAESPASITYPDKAKKAMEKGTAEETGKFLAKEQEALNQGAAVSGKMLTQLDLMEKLYSTPNMPEGELGNTIHQIRSGLKSLGVEVGPEVGAADVARAVASNFALHLRTGDGTNLLPGAMSNYEDKLLQQMAPVLSLTSEGRLALARFMKELAKSNMRMAQEANALAEKNRGILPSEWRVRRERIMKEEMARMAVLNREMMKQFQGAK